MKCACGSRLFSSVAVVLGLTAVGFGGYNLITTGCPLGTCDETLAGSPSVISPAKDEPKGCCALSAPAADAACTAESVEAECHEHKGCEEVAPTSAENPQTTPPAAPATTGPA